MKEIDVNETKHSDYDEWIEEQWRLASSDVNHDVTSHQSTKSTQYNIKSLIDIFIPKEDKSQKTVYLHLKKSLYDTVSHIAEENNLTRGQVITIMIEFFLKTNLQKD